MSPYRKLCEHLSAGCTAIDLYLDGVFDRADFLEWWAAWQQELRSLTR